MRDTIRLWMVMRKDLEWDGTEITLCVRSSVSYVTFET
jgi:hypothetical protein